MKRAEEFKADFGAADDGFVRRVTDTLMELKCTEETPPVRKLRWGVAIALALVLMGVTAAVAAVAGQWGVMDFVNRDGYFGSRGRNANVHAADIVEVTAEPAVVSDGTAAYTVTQTAHDGVCTYLTVHARPLREDVLLLGERRFLGHSTLFLNSEGLGDEMTIAEYCAQQGLEPVKVYFDGMDLMDMTLNADGSSTFILVKNVYAENSGRHPNVYACAAPGWPGMTTEALCAYCDKHQVKLSYHISPRGITARYVSSDSTDFGGLMERPCTVEVIRTEMTNYLLIRWPAGGGQADAWLDFSVLAAGGEAADGAVDYAVTADGCDVITYAAEEVGGSITVRLRRVTLGEAEAGVDGDGRPVQQRHSTGCEEATHTFQLVRVE